MGNSEEDASKNNTVDDTAPAFRHASFTVPGQSGFGAKSHVATGCTPDTGTSPRFPFSAEICAPSASGDAQANALERVVIERLNHVTDPELGRSVIDLHMITRVEALRRCATSGLERPVQAGPDDAVYDVRVDLELTVSGCPLTRRLLDAVTAAAQSCSSPGILVVPQITVSAMSEAKLSGLVAELRASRRRNPFADPSRRTKIFAIASGKGGVGKSSVAANLAAAFAARGLKTAAIDADVYGFSLPGLFGVRSQPTNVGGMLMPVRAWGVDLMSIGMFAGTDRAILWRGPRLQRSLQQFLSDVWWDEPDVLVLDLPPGTGDMAISVAQFLPAAQIVVVTTPQPSASGIAVRAGLMVLQLPGHVAGVVENMSWYEHRGEKLRVFGEGGGRQVADRLTRELGYAVPLLGQIPLETRVRTDGEQGRPTVLAADGSLTDTGVARRFDAIAGRLLRLD